MRVADKVYVINNGSIVLSGLTKEIDRGIAFENAYFGTASAHTSPTE
jgi:ABC-type branched-subunit amino acid transport system ATPase component